MKLILALIVASAIVSAQEPLSELETLKLQNHQLKEMIVALSKRADSCENDRAGIQLQIDSAKIKSDFESNRPGWTWDGTKFTKK